MAKVMHHHGAGGGRGEVAVGAREEAHPREPQLDSRALPRASLGVVSAGFLTNWCELAAAALALHTPGLQVVVKMVVQVTSRFCSAVFP